jgi:formylglycine-generating enzyme required for sulfatase activity
MGSPTSEVGRFDNETQHMVTLTHAFEMLHTEVTHDAFVERMGYAPPADEQCLGSCPVQLVSWHEAASYCNALSLEAGLELCYLCNGIAEAVVCDPSTVSPSPYECAGYRLPTEAEWEYAARSGTTTATYNGDLDPESLGCDGTNAALETIAWYCGNSSEGAGFGHAHPVAALDPNTSGLHDMLGNLWEWCHDSCSATGFLCHDYPRDPVTDPWGPAFGAVRLLRGGSYTETPAFIRASVRSADDPATRMGWVGFRPVRTLP